VAKLNEYDGYRNKHPNRQAMSLAVPFFCHCDLMRIIFLMYTTKETIYSALDRPESVAFSRTDHYKADNSRCPLPAFAMNADIVGISLKA
jgi:hypothetical protein